MINRLGLGRLLGGTAAVVLVLGVWLALIHPESRKPQPMRPREAHSESSQSTHPKTENLIDVEASGAPLSLEEAKKRMIKALSIRDAFKRTAETSIIIEKLCFAGLVEEAWELIDRNPGQVRASQIRIFFRSAQLDPAAFFSKFRQLALREERSLAFEGQLSSYGKGDLLSFIDNPLTKSWLAEGGDALELYQQAIKGSLSEKIFLPIDKSERIDARDLALKFYSEGIIDSNGLAQLLQKDAYLSHGEKLAMLAQAVPAFPTGSLGAKIRKDLVEKSVDEDAARALNEISGRGSEKQGHVDLFNALKKWGVMDPLAANQWFTDHQAGMDQVQRDASARAFFDLALTYGEPDGAEQWAQKVQNDKLRELLLSKLPKREPGLVEPAH